MKLKTCALVLVAFLVSSAQLWAFDGQRKGFILGLGVGASYLNYNEPYLDLNKLSFASNFKLGYAPSNSFEIYYINSLSWFSRLGETSIIGSTGIGLTKYLNSQGTGLFVFGGGGLSTFQILSGGASWGDTGFGLIGGIGYDISKHWSLQGDVVYTNMHSGDMTSVGFRISLNYLAF